MTGTPELHGERGWVALSDTRETSRRASIFVREFALSAHPGVVGKAWFDQEEVLRSDVAYLLELLFWMGARPEEVDVVHLMVHFRGAVPQRVQIAFDVRHEAHEKVDPRFVATLYDVRTGAVLVTAHAVYAVRG